MSIVIERLPTAATSRSTPNAPRVRIHDELDAAAYPFGPLGTVIMPDPTIGSTVGAAAVRLNRSAFASQATPAGARLSTWRSTRRGTPPSGITALATDDDWLQSNIGEADWAAAGPGDWFRQAVGLAEQGKQVKALLVIFRKVDGWLCQSRFEEVDRWLTSVAPQGLSTSVIVGILSITRAAADHLRSRPGFLDLAWAELERRGENATALLSGLTGRRTGNGDAAPVGG